VRVALLGNGFATRSQLPVLRGLDGVEVVALAGADVERARRTAAANGIPLATDDWRRALEPAPDLVLVTTPVDLHRPMASAALEAGAAVLCEKPFTLDADEAAALVRQAHGRAAWIDHELRWLPTLRALRERVRGGAIGAPRFALLELHVPSAGFAGRPWGWWFQRERGGGVLGALGSHLVDLARWILGEPAEVRATLSTLVRERGDPAGVLRPVTADDHARVELRTAGGAAVEIGTSVAAPLGGDLIVVVAGEAGLLRAVGGRALFEGPHEGALRAVETPPPTPDGPRDDLGMPANSPFALGLPGFLRDVVEAVRAGRTEIAEAATFADGLAVQRVLDAARRSSDGGGAWEELA